MRQFLFLVVSVIAIALSSCSEKIPPVKSSIDGYEFFFVEKKGKIYTGLRQVSVHNKRTAKFDAIKPKIIIPAEYDKIEDSKLYRYFDCTKNGQKFLFYLNGNIQFNGKPFDRIEFISSEVDRNCGVTFAKGAFFKVYMKEKDNVGNQKIVAFIGGQEYSGISDFFPVVKGYFYIESGKLGYTRSYRDNNGKLFEKDVIPPGKYDRLFEIINIERNQDIFFIAVKGNKKYFLDENGYETRKLKPGISFKLLNSKIQKKVIFDDYSQRYPARSGTEICGTIFINVAGYIWDNKN